MHQKTIQVRSGGGAGSEQLPQSNELWRAAAYAFMGQVAFGHKAKQRT